MTDSRSDQLRQQLSQLAQLDQAGFEVFGEIMPGKQTQALELLIVCAQVREIAAFHCQARRTAGIDL
jgi:ABC-type transporter Mla MlaB component